MRVRETALVRPAHLQPGVRAAAHRQAKAQRESVRKNAPVRRSEPIRTGAPVVRRRALQTAETRCCRRHALRSALGNWARRERHRELGWRRRHSQYFRRLRACRDRGDDDSGHRARRVRCSIAQGRCRGADPHAAADPGAALDLPAGPDLREALDPAWMTDPGAAPVPRYVARSPRVGRRNRRVDGHRGADRAARRAVRHAAGHGAHPDCGRGFGHGPRRFDSGQAVHRDAAAGRAGCVSAPARRPRRARRNFQTASATI